MNKSRRKFIKSAAIGIGASVVGIPAFGKPAQEINFSPIFTTAVDPSSHVLDASRYVRIAITGGSGFDGEYHVEGSLDGINFQPMNTIDNSQPHIITTGQGSVILRPVDQFEEATQTGHACENWQIEELAYKGLARRKHDTRGWNRMLSRYN